MSGQVQTETGIGQVLWKSTEVTGLRRGHLRKTKKHVCDSQGQITSWDSERLANEAFVWVEE